MHLFLGKIHQKPWASFQVPTAEVAKVSSRTWSWHQKVAAIARKPLEFQKLPSGDLQIVYLGAAVAAQSAGATR